MSNQTDIELGTQHTFDMKPGGDAGHPARPLYNTVHHGDCRHLIELVKDESADLMICDPVYQEIWQYEWTAKQAVRVLKPGRSVICQAGNIHRFEAETAMGVDGLVRRPLLNEIFTGGYGRHWMHKSLRNVNEYIWLTKADEHPYNWKHQYHKWVRIAFWGSKDKTKFAWGDGVQAFVYLIGVFTRPGDLVVDPFAGISPIGEVCIKLGRRYIGFEKDDKRAEQAKARLATAQMPLFLEEQPEE